MTRPIVDAFPLGCSISGSAMRLNWSGAGAP